MPLWHLQLFLPPFGRSTRPSRRCSTRRPSAAGLPVRLRRSGGEGSPSSPPRPDSHVPPSTAASPNSTPVSTTARMLTPQRPRIRRTGGGRYRLTTRDPSLLKDL